MIDEKLDPKLDAMIERAIALMSHRPSCPHCRSGDAFLFDNTKPLWRCNDCGLLYVSAPTPWVMQ